MFKTEFEKTASGRSELLKKIVADAQRIIDQSQSRMPQLDLKHRQEMAKKIEAERNKMNRAQKMMKKVAYHLFPPGTMDAAAKRYNSTLLRKTERHLGYRTKKKNVIRLIDLDQSMLKKLTGGRA